MVTFIVICALKAEVLQSNVSKGETVVLKVKKLKVRLCLVLLDSHERGSTLCEIGGPHPLHPYKTPLPRSHSPVRSGDHRSGLPSGEQDASWEGGFTQRQGQFLTSTRTRNRVEIRTNLVKV